MKTNLFEGVQHFCNVEQPREKYEFGKSGILGEKGVD